MNGCRCPQTLLLHVNRDPTHSVDPCAGPEPLTREAHLQVAALNDAGCCRAGSKGAHFELHAMTHTL